MTPLFKKLNLKDQTDIVVLNAPASFSAETEQLTDVVVHDSAEALDEIPFAIAFATKLAEVEQYAATIAAKAPGDSVVWFAYPKKSSKTYTCEFNRDTGWASLGAAGFEPVRQVAIDADWSALRFRRVEFIKSFTREKKRALTKKGKARIEQSDE